MRTTFKALIAATVAVGACAAMAAPAHGDFHLTKIKEITGSSGNEAAFIELQMYEPGQNLLAGHSITIWNENAVIAGMIAPVAELPLALPNPPNAQSQRTILIGDTGVPGRDYTLDLSVYLDAAAPMGVADAGAVCFESVPVDCVSWGGSAFQGAGNLPDKTAPFGTILGAGNVSFTRKVTGGACPTALEAADDTNNAAADFTGTAASPTPNSASPLETLCPPPNPKKDPPAKAKKCKKKKKKGKASAAAKKCKKKKKKK